MAEGTPKRRTTSKPTPPPSTEVGPVLAGLPALTRLLEAAADWLEGFNKSRKEAERRMRENEEAESQAMEALGELTDHSREREEAVQECALGPQSLSGSWFHKLENNEIVWQGSVVAEIQPGVWLAQLHNWRDGTLAHQRVITVRDIAEHDTGTEFRFYDSAEEMRLAGLRTPQHEYVEWKEE